MTSNTRPRIPRRESSPGRARCVALTKERGRRECRVLGRTRGLACKTKKHTSIVTTGKPKHSGTPCANSFNGFLRALSGDRALLSPSLVDCSANLTPASRHQDHATSPSALAPLVWRRPRVHRIPRSTSVTIAIRPSIRGGTARKMLVIWGNDQAKYFFAREWTGQIILKWLVKLPSMRRRKSARPLEALNPSRNGKSVTRSGRATTGSFSDCPPGRPSDSQCRISHAAG
jgi:hypothetical protein